MNDISVLTAQWLEAKKAEDKAIRIRRGIEDKLIDLLDKNQTTIEANDTVIKITHRVDYKVDADKLVELAQQNGLIDHLNALFRWKPEINLRAWNATNEIITKPLVEAITAKPGRPSFTIFSKEK
jgi:hypothetical protein